MKKQHITPIHPGEVLRDELENLNLTQTALAEHIGVLPKTINEICRAKRGISAVSSPEYCLHKYIIIKRNM